MELEESDSLYSTIIIQVAYYFCPGNMFNIQSNRTILELGQNSPCPICNKKDDFEYFTWKTQFQTEDGKPIGVKGRKCRSCSHLDFFDS